MSGVLVARAGRPWCRWPGCSTWARPTALGTATARWGSSSASATPASPTGSRRPTLSGSPAPAGGVRLLHGTRDDDVPIGQSRAYARAHPGAVLTELEGADHFDLVDPTSAAFGAVVAALTAQHA
ncbi:alpha/beta fold hydrolase [Cnuibacter sp. UC19_7]|uniref:alpha/beta fold hydrolase n=1 Tax=Cnuibacter sp. UC19_7 TaxID=3350166 RepID=UPI00366CE6E7